MRNVITLGTLVLLVALVGCGGPSEDAAKQYIQQRFTGESYIPVNLVNFHKTNGQSGRHPMTGVEQYTMSYECDVEFTEDGFWYGGPWEQKQRSPGAFEGAFQEVKKGQRGKTSGRVMFDKTEKGWMPSGWKR